MLIFLGDSLKTSIKAASTPWAKALRSQLRPQGLIPTLDLAFYGTNSLLNQDQGIRGFLYVANDLLYVNAEAIHLTEWGGAGANGADEKAVTEALRSVERQAKVKAFVDDLTKALAAYDWRASDAPGFTADESKLKSVFRGSGGYRELRLELLRHLESRDDKFSETAKEVRKSIS